MCFFDEILGFDIVIFYEKNYNGDRKGVMACFAVNVVPN